MLRACHPFTPFASAIVVLVLEPSGSVEAHFEKEDEDEND